ncbi:transcriptional regulator, partial [Clostridioides difficile]
KMLKAVEIMQEIGIEYMLEHGQQEILDNKGICYNK